MAERTDVKFNSLTEGIDELRKTANAMYEPIDNFINEEQKIGEEGSAWGGTAAGKAAPILARIRKNIDYLQSIINEFQLGARTALKNYAAADQSAEKAMDELNNIAVEK